jgi:hypothetical protein
MQHMYQKLNFNTQGNRHRPQVVDRDAMVRQAIFMPRFPVSGQRSGWIAISGFEPLSAKVGGENGRGRDQMALLRIISYDVSSMRGREHGN